MTDSVWLTYAWKDNEEADVDHVIAELRARGLDVRYDRARLLAGRRLWDQIDAEISNPAVTAWAMLVTEESLKSEPCQEEIAYAMDRTLRTRGGQFPLIGIFPRPLDRAIIPSALATRLYVNLRDPQWAQKVADGVVGRRSDNLALPPEPYRHKLHILREFRVLEVWPRSGRWYPFVALVPSDEVAKLKSVIHGPQGSITGTALTYTSEAYSLDGFLKGILIKHTIDGNCSPG